MITVERLDKIEQDLKWAYENGDRSAQTRLFVHHVPFLLTILRPVAEELDAMRLEEEEFLAEEEGVEVEESTEDATGSEDKRETIASRIQNLLSPSEDADSDPTYAKVPESEEAVEGDVIGPVNSEDEIADQESPEATDQTEWEETSDDLESKADLDKADPEVDAPEATE